MGYEVPKPIIAQQTWGNSMSQAIQRERMLQHERKIIEQEMEYKKTRDTIADQQFNKQFDLKESLGRTHNDILKQEVIKAAKQNEQLQLQNDALVTQSINTEKERDLMGFQMKDTIAQQKYEAEIAKKRKLASQWGGKDASDWLAKERQRTGISPAGSGGGWWDYLSFEIRCRISFRIAYMQF